jgi:hypothetical protein
VFISGVLNEKYTFGARRAAFRMKSTLLGLDATLFFKDLKTKVFRKKIVVYSPDRNENPLHPVRVQNPDRV